MTRILRVSLIMAVFSVSMLVSGCKQDFEPLVPAPGTRIISDFNVTKTTITSYSPTGSVVLGVADPAQSFIVTAISPTGSEIRYTWSLSGAVVQTGTSSSYSFDPSLHAPATYTLTVVASDSQTDATHSWSVKINRVPTISAPSPSTTKAVSVGSTLSLSATIADPDSDSLTASWTLNGAASGYLSGAAVAGGVASVTLTGHQSFLGTNSITLTVTDGNLSATYSFTIKVNYFNSSCNNLTTGQICSYLGPPGQGSGNAPTSAYFSNISQIDFDSSGNAYILENPDPSKSGVHVWFYNRSGAPITVAGTTVAAGTAAIVAGSGAQSYLAGPRNVFDLGLYYPYGLAVDPTTDDLYVGDSSNGIVKIASGGTTYSITAVAGVNTRNLRYRNISGERRLYFGNITNAKVQYLNMATNVVTDVAGTGAAGTAGDGGLATAATVNSVHSVAFDSNDNLFMVETANCTVRVICATTAAGICSGTPIDAGGTNLVMTGGAMAATAGRIYRFAGTGACAAGADNVAPTASGFAAPKGVEVASGGNIIIVNDPGAYKIRAINTTGGAIVFAGVSVPAYQVKTISGNGSVAPPADGTVAVSSSMSGVGHEMSRVDPTTGHLWTIDGWYVDSYRHFSRVRQIRSDTGVTSTVIGQAMSMYSVANGTNMPARLTPSQGPSVVHIGNNEILFSDNGVKIIKEDGLVSLVASRETITVSGLPISSTGVYRPALGVDPSGNVFFPEYVYNFLTFWNRGSTTLVKYGQTILSNHIHILAGRFGAGGYAGDGGSAPAATLNYPLSAASDGTNMYFVDYSNHCIRKIDNAGTITTFAGTCGVGATGADDAVPTAVSIWAPSRVVVDSSGNVIFTEYNSGVVRMVNTTAGVITAYNKTINPGKMVIIAGGGADLTTEGVSATTASLSGPMGLAINSSGDIFISTYSTHEVRKVMRSGVDAGKIYDVAGQYNPAGQSLGIRWTSSHEGAAATSVLLAYPTHLTVDANDDLYITGAYIPGIKKVKLSP